jgi:hypothetical protein
MLAVFSVSNDFYFCDGAATAFATGVAGVGTLLLAIGFVRVEVVSREKLTVVVETAAAVGVGADLGFPDPTAPVETVRTNSFFSGQNKIARIAMTSRTITMVGQWALVKLQMDDACAVCGTVLFVVAGWVCAMTVVDGVAVAATIGADSAVVGDGVLFTATGTLAGCVAAIGALFAAGLLPPFATSFAIATSVPCMPFNVACTAVSCEGVSVALVASEASNCVSIAASALKVVLKALICAAESSVVATATTTGVALCAPVPAIDAGMVFGVPASTGGTMPACISRFANVAFATSSCCWIAAVCEGVRVCACAIIFPPMLPIATISAAKKSNLFSIMII